MKPLIYVETSVVSFYHEVRTEPEWSPTRMDSAVLGHGADEYTLVTSVAVIEELERGNFPNKQVRDWIGQLNPPSAGTR